LHHKGDPETAKLMMAFDKSAQRDWAGREKPTTWKAEAQKAVDESGILADKEDSDSQ